MPLAPEDRERRLANKCFNERTKLVANTLNAGCIGLVGYGVIAPAVTNSHIFWSVDTLLWFGSAGVLHWFAHFALAYMRSED